MAVIGLGVFGSSLAVALEQGGSEVLGIDSDARKAKRLSHQINCAIADTTSEDALRSMDIATFDSVVVAIDTDFEGSVLTTAALKSLDVRQIICQSSTVHERDILLRVGADQVVEPDYEAARRLAHELTVGERERLSLGQEQSVLKVQIPEHLAGYSLAELDLEPSMDVTVLVIQRKDESMVWPAPDMPWLAGDYLVVLAGDEALATLRGLF